MTETTPVASLRRSMGLADRFKDAMREWTFSMVPGVQERLQSMTSGTNEFGIDPFGLDRDYLLSGAAPFVFLYKSYFRTETHGIERLPEGRVLIIANHGGQLPFDGAMIAAACLVEGDPPRAVRTMVDQWVPTLPFVSTFMSRCGPVVGTPENCRRLLVAGETILVFPEGMRGATKLYQQRYQLQEFGQGFMRLALETDSPIVPVAVVGSEEQAPAIADLKPLAKLLGLPSLPLTPQGLPWPLPVKYRLYFGEPMRFTGHPDDDEELERKVKVVRSRLQSTLQEKLRERAHVFW
jgi:1-acyl-sn-glycerol-3-phosphate acyltransferase